MTNTDVFPFRAVVRATRANLSDEMNRAFSFHVKAGEGAPCIEARCTRDGLKTTVGMVAEEADRRPETVSFIGTKFAAVLTLPQHHEGR